MIEIVIDGQYGRWDAGRWIEPPELGPDRERELLRRLRQPAVDPEDGWRSVEIEGETGTVIEDHADELDPGSAEHLVAVVRTMGGIARSV